MTESEGLETFVQDAPEQSVSERRELANAALNTATHTDEVAEDYAIIGRGLSLERVAAFRAAAYGTTSATDYVGKLFERAGGYFVCRLTLLKDQSPEFLEVGHQKPISRNGRRTIPLTLSHSTEAGGDEHIQTMW